MTTAALYGRAILFDLTISGATAAFAGIMVIPALKTFIELFGEAV